jgi:DNA-damage-inducible protein D
MQNCDPNKKEVAIAQQHFAVSTITLENVEDRVVNAVRVQSRQRTRGLEGGFNIAMQNDGITDLGIGLTRSRGHDAYFGAPTSEIKQRYGIPEDRPVTDFVSNTGIMAIGLAAAITTESLESGKVHGLKQVIKEHMGNNTMIREMLATKGIDTTKIVIQPDIKKVERELKREEKNLITNAKKLRISKRSGG